MHGWVTGVLLLVLISAATPTMARSVTSLGRIEPLNGVYQIAGPSDASVVSKLWVEEGQMVDQGDILATLDTYGLRNAELKRAAVDLDLARKVLKRQSALRQTSVTSEARLEEAERDVLVREAELMAAQERLALARVTAPIDAQVLLVHAREGERIGTSGLLELGQTRHMYVVAEVYETDIGLVKEGQAATITSPALSEPMSGSVERIGSIIGKNDILDLDPVARTDSRVIEVFILLDDPQAVASLTYLQVDVEIHD
jgi:HlyD family secretion protein